MERNEESKCCPFEKWANVRETDCMSSWKKEESLREWVS